MSRETAYYIVLFAMVAITVLAFLAVVAPGTSTIWSDNYDMTRLAPGP